MPDTVTYEYESTCRHCGETLLSERPTDFTISQETKRQPEVDMQPSHTCEFTIHDELDQPRTEELPPVEEL